MAKPSSLARLCILLVLALLLPRIAQAAATQPSEMRRLVLLHVNDVHGQLQERNVAGKSVGGYARLASAVDDVRTEKVDRVLVIHAGDEFSRGDELTTKTAGAANIAIMNRIGFDVWVPGNGDFYIGFDPLMARMKECTAKVLTANLARADGSDIAAPFVIAKVGDCRVALMGLCFIRREHPACATLRMADPVETARKLLPSLRKQADVVIGVTHIGFEQDRRLATAVAGIDIIVGGHTHTALATGRRAKNPDGRDTLICQAGEHLNYMGRVDVTLAREGDGPWRIQESFAKLIPLDQRVKLDPTVTALIAKLSAVSTTKPAPAATPVP